MEHKQGTQIPSQKQPTQIPGLILTNLPTALQWLWGFSM
jgi:hypothetical protein